MTSKRIELKTTDEVVLVEAENLVVEIHRTDEGVVVDIWKDPIRLGDSSLASTYAFFSEGEE